MVQSAVLGLQQGEFLAAEELAPGLMDPVPFALIEQQVCQLTGGSGGWPRV
ncbi:hypothetical protein ACH492_04340 [Streptomyces sp. NPDC019443]|uniref:hypothetical protein n=1 Tax=Streptomyces sp. NPDC019443 TaxID=3365061 RepID=UPI0037ABD716